MSGFSKHIVKNGESVHRDKDGLQDKTVNSGNLPIHGKTIKVEGELISTDALLQAMANVLRHHYKCSEGEKSLLLTAISKEYERLIK